MSAAANDPAVRAAARAILIVDDDPSVRAALDMLVTEITGIIPVLASDGVEALNAAASQEFGAVILDLRMSPTSGREIFESFSAELQQRVIFLTGDAVSRGPQDFLRIAGRPYLLKPVDMADLARALGALIPLT